MTRYARPEGWMVGHACDRCYGEITQFQPVLVDVDGETDSEGVSRTVTIVHETCPEAEA